MKILRRAQTRGGKWAIELHQEDEGYFSVVGFKNGRHQSNASRNTLADATKEYERDIADSKAIDGINYIEVQPPAAISR